MIHEAKTCRALEAVRLDAHLARIEAGELRVELLLRDARIADATSVAPLGHDTGDDRAERGRVDRSQHELRMAATSRARQIGATKPATFASIVRTVSVLA